MIYVAHLKQRIIPSVHILISSLPNSFVPFFFLLFCFLHSSLFIFFSIHLHIPSSSNIQLNKKKPHKLKRWGHRAQTKKGK